MNLMQWDDSLSVNIDKIDEQHKKLLGMINEFDDNLRAGNKRAVSSVLEGLSDYTVQHFALEEQYFDDFAYPDAGAHKKEHAYFVGKVNDIKRRYENGEMALSLELAFFLKKWLVGHIKGTDKKYINCFHDHGLT